MEKLNLKFLQSLATQYPSVAKACTEIINLQAILNLPKETEHFVSDVHGEYEQFLHILKTGSGAIRNKIEDVFGNTLCARDKKSLAALIYYPEQKVERMRLELSEEDFQDWYKVSLHRLIAVAEVLGVGMNLGRADGRSIQERITACRTEIFLRRKPP